MADNWIGWAGSLLSSLSVITENFGDDMADGDEDVLGATLRIQGHLLALECALGMLLAHAGLTESLETNIQDWQSVKEESADELDENVVMGVDLAFDTLLEGAQDVPLAGR